MAYTTIPMAIRNLAFIQIIVGVILIIIDIAVFAYQGYYHGPYVGWRGFSGGAVMVITGIFGVLATRGGGGPSDRRCLLITTLILSIIVALNSLIQFIWLATAVDRRWAASDLAFGIITIFLFVTATVASIAQAVYTGRVLMG